MILPRILSLMPLFLYLFIITDLPNIDYTLASTPDIEMSQLGDDLLFDSWSNLNSPPPSVKSPNDEFTFIEYPLIDQPYPSPAESEPLDDQYGLEQSYDLNDRLAEPFLNSQDYDESHPLSDEITEVVCTAAYDVFPMPMPIDAIKKEFEPEEKGVFMHEHDIIMCTTQTIPMDMPNTFSDSQELTYTVRPADITSAMSQSESQMSEITQESVEMETEQMNIANQQQVNVEHNYTTLPEDSNNCNILNTIDDLAALEEILSQAIESKATPYLKPLRMNAISPTANNDENECHTAGIIDDALKLEEFLNFLDCPQASEVS